MTNALARMVQQEREQELAARAHRRAARRESAVAGRSRRSGWYHPVARVLGPVASASRWARPRRHVPLTR
jgi:hypothetical protein